MKKGENEKPKFFRSAEEFRKWLSKHHKTEKLLWVGYYKKSTGLESIDWPESVDQALCFGWIDGLRKSVDEQSYKIRFTPRKNNSHWSKVNIKKVQELKQAGLMEPAGLKAFSFMKKENSGRASFEQKNQLLSTELIRRFKQDKSAWKYFSEMPDWAQKSSIHWINSAKKDETKERRFQTLIECSGQRKKIPQLRRSGES